MEPSVGSPSPVSVHVRDQIPRDVSPSVPKSLHVPSWTLQAFHEQWGGAARTEALLRLGIVFSVCSCAADAPASHGNLLHSPGTRLSLADTTQTGAFQLLDEPCHHSGCSDSRGRLVSAQSNDQPVPSPLPARPGTVPSKLQSQQTTTAPGRNLPVLTGVWGRLGTPGILRAGVLWCPAGTFCLLHE